MDLSTNVRQIRDSTTDFSFDTSDVYMTTITLASTKEKFNETEWLYEVSWYIMPYTADIPYRVYLMDANGGNFSVPNNNNEWFTAQRYVGSSGYEAFYSSSKFTQAVLEYNETTQMEFKVSVKEK